MIDIDRIPTKELEEKGFKCIGHNTFEKKFCGLATARQVMDYEFKIKTELYPFKVETISATPTEIVIKINDIVYDDITIIDNNEALIKDTTDYILVSVFEGEVDLTDRWSISVTL